MREVINKLFIMNLLLYIKDVMLSYIANFLKYYKNSLCNFFLFNNSNDGNDHLNELINHLIIFNSYLCHK